MYYTHNNIKKIILIYEFYCTAVIWLSNEKLNVHHIMLSQIATTTIYSNIVCLSITYSQW